MGKVEDYLIERIGSKGTIHLTLIDPEKTEPRSVSKTAKLVERAGSAAIMVGGSTSISVHHLDQVVKAIKRAADIPVILFPSDVAGISSHADAIFFMSLLNSSNPYYITGAQALGSRLVKRFGLEPIPLAYVIIGDDAGAAGYIGHANPIPYSRPEVVAMYALAAEYLGMHFVYLEAGSGAKRTVPPRVVSTVKKTLRIPVIVGGGIRTPKAAREIARSGADVIVTGTVTEEASPSLIGRLIASTKVRRK